MGFEVVHAQHCQPAINLKASPFTKPETREKQNIKKTKKFESRTNSVVLFSTRFPFYFWRKKTQTVTFVGPYGFLFEGKKGRMVSIPTKKREIQKYGNVVV